MITSGYYIFINLGAIIVRDFGAVMDEEKKTMNRSSELEWKGESLKMTCFDATLCAFYPYYLGGGSNLVKSQK